MLGSAETTVIASPNLYPVSPNHQNHIFKLFQPKSIWNTYSKRKCHAACRPASQPASQPASRHKNLDFQGCPGSLAKPIQIDPLGALLGPGEQFSILTLLAAVLFNAKSICLLGRQIAALRHHKHDSTSRPLPDQLDSQPPRQSASPSFDQPASEWPNQLFSEPAIQPFSQRAQTARREHCQTEAEGEAVREAASQPVGHPTDQLLLFSFLATDLLSFLRSIKSCLGSTLVSF